MKRLFTIAVVSAAALLCQTSRDPLQRRMPDGRTQGDHLLEHEHKQSREDIEELVKLAEELQEEFEKNDHNVLSLDALRKAEQIEKLAKKIKNRLKRF